MQFLHHVKDINHQFSIQNETLLHLAVRYGLEDVLTYILSRNPDVEIKDFLGRSVVHWLGVSRNYMNIAKILVEHVRFLEIPDMFGVTPIWNALANNRYDLVEFFLKNGATIEDTEKRDLYGRTMILGAIGSERWGLVKTLLLMGANPLVTDDEGKNALHYLFSTNNFDAVVFECLMIKGCDINALNDFRETPFHVFLKCYMSVYNRYNETFYLQLFLENNAQFNKQDRDGNSELILSAGGDFSLYFILALMKGGTDVTLRNNANENFLDILFKHQRETAEIFIKYLIFMEKIEPVCSSLKILLSGNEKMLLLHESCTREIDKLDSIKIDDRFSLFEIYALGERKMRKFCYKDDIRNAMKNFDPNSFPLYGNFMATRFRETLEIYHYRDSCWVYLEEMIGESVDPETFRKVMNLVTTKQLERLNKLCIPYFIKH